MSDLPFPIPRLVRVRERTLSLTLALVKPFYIFNSLTRAVEEFQPLNPPEVTLYSCGPTVYLPPHLGNMLEHSDAALIIGDAALLLNPAALPFQLSAPVAVNAGTTQATYSAFA